MRTSLIDEVKAGILRSARPAERWRQTEKCVKTSLTEDVSLGVASLVPRIPQPSHFPSLLLFCLHLLWGVGLLARRALEVVTVEIAVLAAVFVASAQG